MQRLMVWIFYCINTNVLTLKLPYTCSDASFGGFLCVLRREYTSAVNFGIKRFADNYKEIDKLICDMNNVCHLDSWLIASAATEACTKFKLGFAGGVFGGKSNRHKYLTGKITKEEYKKCRLRNLVSVGEVNYHGNRKFNLVDDILTFKYKKAQHYTLNLKVQELESS